MAESETPAIENEYALIVMQAKNAPKVMMTFLRLILNYQCGLDVLSVEKLTDVVPMQLAHGDHIRAPFLIQDVELKTRNLINLLTRRPTVPLFLLLPLDLAEVHNNMSRTLPNLHVCTWDKAFGQEGTSMPAHHGEGISRAGPGSDPH